MNLFLIWNIVIYNLKEKEENYMAKLVAFYSRADENYFGGTMRYIKVGNTKKIAEMIADCNEGRCIQD